jgi:hypothetical protein
MLRSPGPKHRPSALALAFLAWLAACVCPAPAAAVADANFRTPLAAFKAYQAYLASDLVDREYRCYSAGFRRREQLSLGTYTEARALLLAERPWLKLFAKAEVVREWPLDERAHVIEARVGGRTVHVRLVREDSFEIRAGSELVADGYAPFDELVRTTEAPEGTLVEARVPTRTPSLPPATSLLIESAWKIDDLYEAEATGESGRAPPTA